MNCCKNLGNAIYDKHVTCYKKIIQEDPSSVNRLYHGELPINTALYKKDYKCVDYLLKCKEINLSTKNEAGRTFLGALCRFDGNAKYIKKILGRKDVNVNTKDKCGNTILHNIAYESSNMNDVGEYVKLLVGGGININGIGSSAISYTPLRLAVVHFKENIVRILLENGADPDIKSISGISSFGDVLESYFYDDNSAYKDIIVLCIRYGSDKYKILDYKNDYGKKVDILMEYVDNELYPDIKEPDE